MTPEQASDSSEPSSYRASARYRLRREETETVIRFSAADTHADVWSEDPKIQRKAERAWGPGEPAGEYGKRWSVPIRLISFRKERELSEERKQQLREQAARMHERRQE